MELPTEGFYCVAKASNNSIVEATAHFPYSIDLSKQKAEVAIKYIAITPTWKQARGLYVHLTDDPSGVGDSDVIHFDDINAEDGDSFIRELRNQIDMHNKGRRDPMLKILKSKSGQYSMFKLRKNMAARFSKGLARLTGIADETEFSYVSRTEPLEIRIKPPIDDLIADTDIYYLKSEEIASNFLLDSKQDRIIELLHIPGSETLDFTPTLTYSTLEVGLLQHLVFTLYDSENRPVSTKRTDIYIVCHVRPKK